MTEPPLSIVGGTEDRGGNEPHEPTDYSRKRVYALAEYGVAHRAIAADLGIAINTMRRHYMTELIKGDANVQALIGQTTIREAIGYDAQYNADGSLKRPARAPNAMLLMFLCKSRLGFRDGGPGQIERGEVPSDDGLEFNTAGLSERERVERVVGILDTARARRAGRPIDGADAVGAVSAKPATNGARKPG